MTTFDRITTGIKADGGRYRIWIRYENSDTGEARYELSTRRFTSASTAEDAAVAVAKQLQSAAELQARMQ